MSICKMYDRSRRMLPAFALTAVLLSVTGAHADDLDTPTFLFSGFGTVGAAHSSEHQADYTNSPNTRPNGAGATRNWSADVDSRVGVQVIANVTPQLSAVLQILSQQRYDNTYRPVVEWANIKYAFTPDFNVRVGRIAMPTFLVGDYRNVGYAIPWVRPPVALYSRMIPITTSDGIDASYRLHLGEVQNTLQVNYGDDVIRTTGNTVPSTVKKIMGIFNTVEVGPTTLRASYQTADLTIDSVNPFFNAFRQFGPAGVALADKYRIDNRRISFLSLGASYDPGHWFLMGEWGKGKFSSFVGTQTAWYVSSGYRFGTWTPYATFARSKKLSDTSDPGLNLTALPPGFTGAAAGLNAGLNALLQPTTGSTVSIGTRWDFKKNAAFKLQYDYMNLDPNSSGGHINVQPGYQPGGVIRILSATVDFVF